MLDRSHKNSNIVDAALFTVWCPTITKLTTLRDTKKRSEIKRVFTGYEQEPKGCHVMNPTMILEVYGSS